MTRNVPITPEKEDQIRAAMEKYFHASGGRALGDVSYATVWRVADRNNIELTAGRKSGACCFTGAAHFRTALL